MDRTNNEHGRMQVLVVEDDEIMLLSLLDRLKLEGIEAIGASTLAEARRWLGTGGIDLVVSDIRLPDGSGRDLFQEIAHLQPGLPFILMTGFGSVADAVELVKAGAIDYLEKPFDLRKFVELVRHALATLADMRLANEGTDDRYLLGSGLLGRDPAMLRIERTIARLRHTDTPVLITGERGTGKKQVAGMIHGNSRRRRGPFIKLNCAPWESDREAEEAFTDAVGRAAGGTLFLTELAELPERMQARLLQFVSKRQADLRVIAARRSEAGEHAAAVRPDLVWRLDVVHIRVPPLRERPEDIIHLARIFLAQAAEQLQRRISGFSADAETCLAALPLPGNGSELRKIVMRAATLADGPQVEAHHIQTESECPPSPVDLKTVVEDAERTAIRAVLSHHGGAIGKAAESLGISRKNLWEKMKRYDIEG